MSTPFIALMLVLAGILLWAIAMRFSLHRQAKALREHQKAYKARLRDFLGRQAAEVAEESGNVSFEGSYGDLLGRLDHANDLIGRGIMSATLVVPDPRSPSGTRWTILREVSKGHSTYTGRLMPKF